MNNTLYLTIETDAELPELNPLLEGALAAAANNEEIEAPVCVSLMLTDGEAVRALNAEFRGIDAETDVLSFPANELPQPLAALLRDESFEPETEGEAIALGDIAISVPRAREQAAEYGHSLERELCFLFTHGVLHLLGYDHIEPDDEAVMREKQRAVLEKINVLR